MAKRPPAENPLVLVKTQLEAMAPQFKAALPKTISVEKMTRTVMVALQRTPKLMEANRPSLYNATMQCATDGLIPDGREAVLTTFGKDVAYIPMIGGLLKLMRNSGDLKEISAQCVYENDHFRYELGDNEFVEHRPEIFKDRGAIIMTYCIAKTKDGGIFREFMTEEDIAKVKSFSQSGSKGKGPWKEWPEMMRKKSVIRRIAKRMPRMSDMIENVMMHGDDTVFPDDDRATTTERTGGPDNLKQAMRDTGAIPGEAEEVPAGAPPAGEDDNMAQAKRTV